MRRAHDVRDISFSGRSMILRVGRKTVELDLATVSPALANASPLERSTYRLSPAGYGIHWPLLDEDLSIAGLLRAAKAKPRRVSKMRR